MLLTKMLKKSPIDSFTLRSKTVAHKTETIIQALDTLIEIYQHLDSVGKDKRQVRGGKSYIPKRRREGGRVGVNGNDESKRQKHSYQSTSSALTSSQRDLDLYKAAKGTNVRQKDVELFRRSLWSDDAGKEEQFHDTLFSGQGRYGRNPKSIDRKCIKNRPY